MPRRRPYPSDLSDARWELIEPVLSAWRFERRGRALDFGRPPERDLRDMDATLYVDRTGVQWRYLPRDFPHWNTVYGYFARWQQEGVFAQLVGRKRSIVTDTTGLLLAALVTAASVQDSIAGTQLLDQVAAEHPRIRKVWVDDGYRQRLVEHAVSLGIDMEITQRLPGTRGFTPIPKRWVVERTYGWLMLHRRLARDYETLPARSEAMVHIAMTDLTVRRLTGENTSSWHDPTQEHQSLIPR
ncbi:transposase [Streptomyces aquilus]|uniref:transposase n=1 Tax=Streptomyces aquilus TaxID=2548456 RepID=UPI0036786172